MSLLEEIRKSDKKGKELCLSISELIKQGKVSAKDFEEAINAGNDSVRGTCVEALEFATQTKPEAAKPFIAITINCLKDKASRVKWESAKVIGNIAKKMPKDAEKAIDLLLENTNDKGTVVRWSTAFALTEIAKYNNNLQENLIRKINEIIKKEKNNGVKNVYLATLRTLR